MALNIIVKNTTGARFEMQISSLAETVADFKVRLATSSGIPAASQRLIFRGHILKDAQTFEQIKAKHGLESGQSMHVVPSPSSAPSASANATPSTPTAPSSNQTNAAPAPQLPTGMPNMAEMQQQLLQNPEQMQAMMNSPLMENIMNNPQVARSLMMANPQMRDLLDRNPELAHVFNDPSTFRQMMQMARNPSLMNEMMRNTDRQMANIEMMPGGFDALRRMHENIQAPLMDATQGFNPGNQTNPNRPNASDDNPFTSLFQQNTPSNTPMPNPWAPNNGVQPNAAPRAQPTMNTGANTGTANGNAFAQLFQGVGGADNGAAGGTPGVMPGFPGMGMGTGGMPGLPPGMDIEQLTQLMENPMMQQMMDSLLSNPQTLQAMINSDPSMRAAMENNPQMAQVLQNPEMLRTMMNPEVMRSMRQLQNAFGGMGMGATPGATPTAPGTGAGQTPNTGQTPSPTPQAAGGMDAGAQMNGFMAMMNAMAAGGAPGTNTAQPQMTQEQLEEMYSTQLQQLRDMGFLDKSMCLQALQQSRGNVSAAIENLLSRFGG